jgi:hypothetical protein
MVRMARRWSFASTIRSNAGSGTVDYYCRFYLNMKARLTAAP